ncbi:MAG: hypothetical protein NC299_12470 [Lachnospiraceae bacterium]|nr:hypothetical protein [Ruminococcus sp.]MCM1276154.1 hypothetical protein [Lachnospiraceae bacterium]
MKKIVSALAAAALLTALTACGDAGSSSSPSSVDMPTEKNQSSSGESTSGESASESSESSSESSSEPVPSEPAGEPTFLIGLDGKPVLTSEITRLEDTDKTAETLTAEDFDAKAYCDGFTYLKEPCGISYDSYNNPDMFDGWDFLGELPETNEWKRVYVGDEICGLRVKSASVGFWVYELDERDPDIPEKYFGRHNNDVMCEFEGTVEVEGFLQVLPNYVQYPLDSELVTFYPCKGNLPVSPGWPDDETGYSYSLRPMTIYDHMDDELLSEYEGNGMGQGYLCDITCDLDGIGHGDIAYVRATLGDIWCGFRRVGGKLENVERLSDILAHDEDVTEYHQPAPVKD